VHDLSKTACLVIHSATECDIWQSAGAETARWAMAPTAAPDERVLVLVPVCGGTRDGLLDLGPGVEAPTFEVKVARVAGCRAPKTWPATSPLAVVDLPSGPLGLRSGRLDQALPGIAFAGLRTHFVEAGDYAAVQRRGVELHFTI
jgi:hypothetical protein